MPELKKINKESSESKTTVQDQDDKHNTNSTRIEGEKVHLAFMDYLLEIRETGDYPSLTDTQIRNEVDTFMAAGHDTTAYAVSWTLFLLATYPEHQRKVQEELDLIFPNNNDGDKPQYFSTSQLSNVPYLNLCLKEALRLYPIVPFNFRKVNEDIQCGDGRLIPAQTNVVIMPYVMHKDPSHFPSPEEFQPSRFLAENCLRRHPFSYLPFSLGPRNCIGQKFGVNEAKVMLCHLLRNYSFTAVKKREEIKLDLDLVIRPMDGLWFKIRKRRILRNKMN